MCERVARELRERGMRMGGVRQEPVFDGEEHVGYDVIDLSSGTRLPLARTSATPRLCKWAFESTAFEQARDWAREERYDVTAFDVASLESSGEGHWPAITDALASNRLVLLSLRPRVLGHVAMRLEDPVCGLELPAAESEIDAFVREVADRARDLRDSG